MKNSIQKAMDALQYSRSRDDYENKMQAVGKAAHADPKSAVDLYITEGIDHFSLIWALQGCTEDYVVDLFITELKNENQYIRWAAIEGLQKLNKKRLIPYFIMALKDRSHLVKGVAVSWLSKNGDATAVSPLEHIVGLKSLQKNAPGIVKEANEALKRIRK